MPNVSITLPGIDQAVTRPIIFDIAEQIRTILKMDKSAKILFPGDLSVQQQPGSSIDDHSRSAKFAAMKGLYIEVEEDYDLETIGTTAVSRREHIPVFKDTDLGVFIRPVYATSSVTIHFKFKTLNKTEAVRWRDDIRIRSSQLRDIQVHDITYHYPLPEEYLKLLLAIYTLREQTAGYGDEFNEYVLKHCTNRLSVIGDLVNHDCRLAISEKQTRIIGIFDFVGIPDKIERDESTALWICGFSYRFNYDKPVACNIRYPIMVHNQLLPREYVVFNTHSPDLPPPEQLSFSESMGALQYFECHTWLDRYLNTSPLIRLPVWDEFIPQPTARGIGSIFTALCHVDLADHRSLFDLTEIDPFVFDADIADFIRQSEYPYIGKLYESIFYLELYRNERPVMSGAVSCDAQLSIKSNFDLDPRMQHRVRFGLMTDLTMLKPEAIQRLRQYPKAFVKIVAALNEILRNNPAIQSLGSKRYITLEDFNAIYLYLTGSWYQLSDKIPGNTYYMNDIFMLLNGPQYPIDPNARRRGTVFDQRTMDYPLSNRLDLGTITGPGHHLDPLRYIRHGQGLENLRRNQMTRKTVQVHGIIAVRSNR